ncbi:MAG TPA: hypothetical protein VMP89_13040, partial [Solirubrobacteraceae bacterium]|nr:hypothetical protein [Solirubrobacteraceae bacterium]
LMRAEDRDRHDRGAGLERQPPDAGARLLGQLAVARAPALAVHAERATAIEELGLKQAAAVATA